MENPLQIGSYIDSLDNELIQASKKGDKNSLNDLLNRHQDYIFNVALKMMNNIADAEDATQEVLIKLITNLSKYDSSKSNFRTWLYRITFNHILNLKKGAHEKYELTFDKFFSMLDSIEDDPISEKDKLYMGESIEEARVSCTAAMLMCLNREERLTYIIGEVFKINHTLASEIFEITPANFRKKLSRARQNIHQWMHKKCGLINSDNPCRCINKTKQFIKNGWVDPNNKKWLSNYKDRIYTHTREQMGTLTEAYDELYTKIYQQDPFKKNLKAKEVYEEILNHKDFSKILDINPTRSGLNQI